jgi:glutaredoxin
LSTFSTPPEHEITIVQRFHKILNLRLKGTAMKALLLKAFREGVGRLIVFISFITLPRKKKRSPEEQQHVNDAVKNLSMYQFYACPWCVKTRRAIHRLNLPINYLNSPQGSENREILTKEGGRLKVPCLRIEKDGETQWMYESNDIISYLDTQFG